MANDPKSTTGNSPALAPREKGVRIFTYPKIIFIFPTLIMSLICWVGMWMVSEDPTLPGGALASRAAINAAAKSERAAAASNTNPGDGSSAEVLHVIPSAGPIPIGEVNPTRFRRPENVLGLIFLGVVFFNLLVLAIDFPRFTIFAGILLGTTILFFLLWLGMFVRILEPLERLFQRVYVIGNAQFYFLFSLILLAIYAVIFASRWLDYWEVLPNEILHHHGPLSDLERYPTMNMKFDKEIPDVFEHLMFGAGRLVLHLADERKAIVLDTVLHVTRKEDALKKLMSRLEVRVTTDQEVASP